MGFPGFRPSPPLPAATRLRRAPPIPAVLASAKSLPTGNHPSATPYTLATLPFQSHPKNIFFAFKYL